MNLKLNNQIVSSEDLKDVIAELQEYAKWFNHASILAKVSKRKSETKFDLSDPFSNLIEQWQDGKPLTIDSLDNLISNLKDYLAKTPKIRITLAAMPPLGIKKSLVDWCRANVSQALLVDFRYNSSLIGGMVVNVGSHTYDWSFKRQLLASKDKLDEVIKRV